TPRPCRDFELLLVPAAKASSGATAADIDHLPDWFISLDIPDLPPHPPGMIPIGMVRDGYVKDLRKQAGGKLSSGMQTAPQIPNAKTQLVRSTWNTSSGSLLELGLVFVRDDHVYILRARSPAGAEAA